MVRQQLGVGVAIVDGLEYGRDRFGLTLGAQDGSLGVALGLENGRLAGALGGEDRGLFGSLSGEDERTAVTFGAHLLFHRVLNGVRRFNGLEFNSADTNAPLTGGFVEHDAELAVDIVPAGEGLFEV